MPYQKYLVWIGLTIFFIADLHAQPYPENYFRNPLNIPMQLVANFGEIRTNHWHMGLDIRTQHKVNLPVYAAADGYIARVSIEPGGFGQAIYINHPNGYTTLYAHLNAFFPALAQYVKEQQYQQQSWQINLDIPPQLFPVHKSDVIALSGSTGASEGPHVHFEIRETKTDNCLNPLLFKFPVADAVPPTLLRLAMYDRNKSIYDQLPQLSALRKSGGSYALAKSDILRTGSNRVSFAIGAFDRLSNTNNPNGIYSARITVDGVPQSQFILNNIDYDETRYLNAQIDYRYHYNGGPYLQHLSKMPGDNSTVYNSIATNGIINLLDSLKHLVEIEVQDANQNNSRLQFYLQYDSSLSKPYFSTVTDKLFPGNVNIFENNGFELYTTDCTVYDTVNITYGYQNTEADHAISPKYNFCSAAIPVQDSITIRLKPSMPVSDTQKNCIVIKGVAGTKTEIEKANWNGDWLWTKFRQLGSYQAFVDVEPPIINAPGYGDTIDLRKSYHMVFTPRDNFGNIKSFKAELDGQWLLFTNDKGHSFIYTFDEHFPPGVHQLKVIIQDIAGNSTVKTWYCRR